MSGGTRGTHLEKLLRDAEAGRLPLPQEEIDEIRAELEKSKWNPPSWINPLYVTFWEIRVTKAHESPINHQDLKSWCDLRGVFLDNWCIDTILEWDRAYYAAARRKE